MRPYIRNFIPAFFLCGLASLLASSKLNYPLTGIDDANIYFVYAKNLAGGHGFVYNVGGERVEGFTSLLWTLVSALVFRLSAFPEITLWIVNIVLISAGIAFALDYLQQDFVASQENGGRSKIIWSAAFLILLVTSPRYIAWNTITLMENGLWSALLLITTIFVIRVRPSFAAVNFGFIPLSILLLLTRPESIAWTVVFAALLLMRMARAMGIIASLKTLAPSIACIIITLALLTLFRLQYFGYPLPNTYYAKVSPSLAYNLAQGINYLAKYSISDPIVLLCIVAIFVSALHSVSGIFSKRAERVANDGSFLLPLIAATGLLLPALTGGDHFGSFRLYQNIYPIEILCLLYFADRVSLRYYQKFGKISQGSGQRGALNFSLALIAISGLMFSQYSMWNSIKSELDVEFRMADYGRKSGAFIQELFEPLRDLPAMGVVTSGGIKYAYSGDVVDLMGLNNTIMAHNPGDRKGIKNHAAFDIATFYRLQPTVVWPLVVDEHEWQYSESGLKESWENTEGLRGLFDESKFLKLYTYAKVSRPTVSREGYILVAWFKKDFLQKLRADGSFRITQYEYAP